MLCHAVLICNDSRAGRRPKATACATKLVNNTHHAHCPKKIYTSGGPLGAEGLYLRVIQRSVRRLVKAILKPVIVSRIK